MKRHQNQSALAALGTWGGRVRPYLAVLGALSAAMPLHGGHGDAPLRVCATTPDLQSLVEEVGGADVAVTALVKGPQDPHYLEAKPSAVKLLHDAELFVEVGLGLEDGWVPVLLRSARNPDILPGGRRHLSAAAAIEPLEVPAGALDRSAGDVHPLGNPHYLLDPMAGLRVARLLRDRLAELRPSSARRFAERCATFERKLEAVLYGEEFVKHRGDKEAAEMVAAFERGGLKAVAEHARSRGEEKLLGGLVAELLPIAGAKVVADHNLWPYFTRRFGLEVVGFLEPKPGLTPTTAHLSRLVEDTKAHKPGALLTSPYFPLQYARFLSVESGIPIASMAHQVGARDGVVDYAELIRHNARELRVCLERRRASGAGP